MEIFDNFYSSSPLSVKRFSKAFKERSLSDGAFSRNTHFLSLLKKTKPFLLKKISKLVSQSSRNVNKLYIKKFSLNTDTKNKSNKK